MGNENICAGLFEIYYLEETNQYIFIFYNNSNFKIILLNDNYSKIQIDSSKEQISF